MDSESAPAAEVSEERRAAYHEAGHAIVACGLGLEVDRVELFDPGGTTEHLGRCAVFREGPAAAQWDVFAAGGLASEALFFASWGPSDYAGDFAAMDSVPPASPPLTLWDRLTQAMAILRPRRAMVAEIAERLLVERVLTGEQVAAVFWRGLK